MELITLTPRTIGNKRNRQLHLKRIARLREKKRLLTSRPPLHVLPNPKKKALQKDSKRFEKNSRAMKVDIKYVRVAPKTNLSNVSLPLPKEFYPSNLKV